jgi:Ca2+-binding EF-hand superfamily protein
MANGKEVITRAELTDPRSQMSFDRAVQTLGITDGRLTRQQYLTYMEQRMAQRGNRGPGGPGGPPSSGASGSRGGFDPDTIAERIFRRLDTNGDGVLNYDEMAADESLRAERDKWDTNRDGFIDLNEFKAYFRARAQQFQTAGRGGWSGAMPAAPARQEEKRPTVYRAGQLPPNLPAWFAQYDTDHDGQIGLYEWKAAGQPVEKFLEMDRNGDGFLTVEEVLRTLPGAQGGTAAQGNTPGAATAGAPGGPPGQGGSPWGGNGQGRGGWGRGGWGGGPPGGGWGGGRGRPGG